MTRQPDLEFSLTEIEKEIGGGFTEKHERFILAEARKIAQASRGQTSMKQPRTIADVEGEAEEYEAHIDEEDAQTIQTEDAQEQGFHETDEPY